MQNLTGVYIAQQRHARHLTLGQLAARAKYSNTSRGARRIAALEREGILVDGLLTRLIDALDLDRGYVQTLLADDLRAHQEAWVRWADEPVEPELRVRLLAAVWSRTPLPTGCSKGSALTYASDRARRTKLTHVLVWSRREEVWCYPNGSTGTNITTFDDTAGATSIIAGERVVFG